MPTETGDFHQPYVLLDKNGFDENFKKAQGYCRRGLPARESVESAFNIILPPYKWNKWRRWVEEDVADGFTDEDSNLIKLFLGMAKIDNNLHLKLAEKAFDMADDGDPEMVKFLLKTRYDYSEKKRTDVEITNDDAPISFNIVDMKPNEDD